MRAHVLSGSVAPPSSVNPEIPLAVSRIVMRAIARDPAERFQSAGHFADALSNWNDPLPDSQTSLIARDRQTVQPTQQLDRLQLDSVVTDHEPHRRADPRHHRRAAAVAWLSIAVALVSLIWIASNLIDLGELGSDDPNPGVASDSPTPTSTVDLTPTAVAVPTAISLIGMTVEGAQNSTDFAIRVVATEVSDTVPAGQIIRQSPNPGRPVRTGDLAVVVSSGAGPQPIDLATMTVAGQPFDAVAEQLVALGLNVRRVSEGSIEIPDGNVIRITEADAMPGETVEVVTSVGDRVQIPPDLQSRRVDDVVRELDRLGFETAEPIAVSRERIISFNVDLEALAIVDGDVVGLQEEEAGFGQWVPRGATITPVYYDASLDQ
jgi:serine/threonine-protein kinase